MSDPLELDLQVTLKVPDWCGCWQLNPGPLQEENVLLTSEPSLQTQLPLIPMFKDINQQIPQHAPGWVGEANPPVSTLPVL